jgi:hypothetical protein
VLSISFEKKLKIEKECEKFYKLGRQLEMVAVEKTARFVMRHLEMLVSNIKVANSNYMTHVLKFLEYANRN